MKLGISIKEKTGIGDKVQFSSLPENYFRATGQKLIDVSKCWIFDHNPFVERDVKPDEVKELWNFGPQVFEWPRPRESVYLSNAEIWATLFGVPVSLNRPRLYQYENWPLEQRKYTVIHTSGKSNGPLSEEIIHHIVKKYKPIGPILQIGSREDPSHPDVDFFETKTLWNVANLVSRARFFIGVDSGPSWIAACYPDVITKKIRVKTVAGQKEYKDWVPLEIDAFHSHWDDRLFQIYNTTENDVGFMQSYKKL